MNQNWPNLDGAVALLIAEDQTEEREVRSVLGAKGCRVHCAGPRLDDDSVDESYDVGIIATQPAGGWTARVIVALRAAPLACAAVTILDAGARHEITNSLRYGAVDCITRPYAPAELFECIGHAIASTHRWRARLAGSDRPKSGAMSSLERVRSRVFEPPGHVAAAAAINSDQRVERMVERLAQNHRLTPREREVLYWLVQGHRYDDIATLLGVVPRTAKFHAANLLRKLDLDSRHDLPRLLILEG